MFEETDSVLNNDSVSSFKHFLQILQNLEFTHAKFLLWSQKLSGSVDHT
jgi:hypothetical protein